MHLLRLSQYTGALLSQGYHQVKDVLAISIEDLEDIGFYMLGHQKRLLLGIRRIKELRTGKLQSIAEYCSTAEYHPEELTMSSLPPTLQSKQSFSSFHSAPGEITLRSISDFINKTTQCSRQQNQPIKSALVPTTGSAQSIRAWTSSTPPRHASSNGAFQP